VEAALLKKMVK
jgi:hypothetical protein